MLTKVGEEYLMKNSMVGASITVLLFNQSTDALGDLSDVGDITTEPADGNYARQTDSLEVADVSDNWAFRNVNQISFDVTNTTGNVDQWGIIISYQAAADGSITDHLVAFGDLSQTRDLSQIDTLNIAAQSIGSDVD